MSMVLGIECKQKMVVMYFLEDVEREGCFCHGRKYKNVVFKQNKSLKRHNKKGSNKALKLASTTCRRTSS